MTAGDANFAEIPPEIERCAPKEQLYVDIRPRIQAKEIVTFGTTMSMIEPAVIYESYSPEDTHQMREYILHVILHNIERMRKYKLVSEAAYLKFRLLSKRSQKINLILQDTTKNKQSLEDGPVTAFRKRLKRLNARNDPEYLRFDSAIESGNLERVEAFPINHSLFEKARAQHQTVVQKYNLFCKVDTNTKGHQQWFYFRVKNTKKNTRYQFSIMNFTKPFSLFGKGMKIQILSKRAQKDYVEKLQEQAAAVEREDNETAGEELDSDVKLFLDEGIIREQWSAAGTKIEYLRSKLERSGWNEPGSIINIDDEEDANVEQDDLNASPSGNPIAPEGQSQPTSPSVIPQRRQKRCFYQMNFELEFPHEDDTVYIAYSRPYPYSQIIAHMFETEIRLARLTSHNPNEKITVRETEKDFKIKIARQSFVYDRSLLCTTISGLPVPSISITATKSSIPVSKRKIIFVTSRVHPGETNASTVFEGFLDHLASTVENSQILANFVVKLVPCMNPDGVVCGNYRSSVAGVDLNRQWILPSRDLHPEVYHTKALMHQLTKIENRKILIYCDIHCHSKKKNSFLYGCNTAAEGAPFSTWTQVRLLPRLLARRSQFVSLPSCIFGIEACKSGTARVVVWKEFHVMNSFTLENSFYGYDHGPETRLYTQDCYRQLGASLALTLNDYRVCIAQIEKEMIESKGWLKPMKLKEITGVPAAQVIADEIRQKRTMAKRAIQIRKYEERLVREQRERGFTIAPMHINEQKTPLTSNRPRKDSNNFQNNSDASPLPRSSRREEVRETQSHHSLEKMKEETQIAPTTSSNNGQIQECNTEQSDEGKADLEREQELDDEASLSSGLDHRGASAKPSERGRGSDQGAETVSEHKNALEALEQCSEPVEQIRDECGTQSENDYGNSKRERSSSVLQIFAEKINELSDALEMEPLAIPEANQDNLMIRDEAGVITPQIQRAKESAGSLTVSIRDETVFKTPLKAQLAGTETPKIKDLVVVPERTTNNKSSTKGRDSCQTLLADSERDRRSVRQKNLNYSQEVMMRGKFGENPKVAAADGNSSMLLRSGLSLQSSNAAIGSKNSQDEQYWDEHGEYCADIHTPNHHLSSGEINSPLSVNKVKNWRQLFDQDELNLAYQQSEIGFKDVKIEVKPGAKRIKIKLQESIVAETPRGQTRQSQSNVFLESLDENDDSGDDDSVDDLNEVQLLRQVYMKKESAIENAMRSTAKAQSKFFNEMKVMINSKKEQRNVEVPQTSFWSQVNQESNKGQYYDPATSLSFDYKNVSQQHRDKILQLTGKHIEMAAPPETNQVARLNNLRPGKLSTNNFARRLKNQLNTASRNKLLAGTSASLGYIEEVLKSQIQRGQNVQPLSGRSIKHNAVAAMATRIAQGKQSRAMTLSVERSLGSLGRDKTGGSRQQLLEVKPKAEASEPASAKQRIPYQMEPVTKFTEYLLHVKHAAEQDSIDPKIQLKKGIMKRSYREQQISKEYELNALRIENSSIATRQNEEEEDPMLLSHRFNNQNNNNSNRRATQRKSSVEVGAQNQKTPAQPSQQMKRANHIASRLRNSVAKKIVVPAKVCAPGDDALPSIQTFILSESLSLKALASRQIIHRLGATQGRISNEPSPGRKLAQKELKDNACHFSLAKLSNRKLPKIVQSQVASAGPMSSKNLTDQVAHFGYALTTQRSSMPESPVKRPIQCESPKFVITSSPERKGMNADLSQVVTKANDLRTTMHSQEKQGLTSDIKLKRSSMIGQVNISINTSRANNDVQSSLKNMSSRRTSSEAAEQPTDVQKDARQMKQVVQLSARLHGISVGREVSSTAERIMHMQAVVEQEKEETTLPSCTQITQSPDYLNSNSSDNNRQVSSLLMASIDSRQQPSKPGSKAKDDQISRYLAAVSLHQDSSRKTTPPVRIEEQKQNLVQEVESEKSCSADLAAKLSQSLKMYASPFAAQSKQQTTSRMRYVNQPLPNITQSIDNAKIQQSLQQKFSGAMASPRTTSTDQYFSEAGCFEDRNSLANLNILQAAHTGISPNQSVMPKRQHLQSTIESGMSCLRGYPPGLLRIQQGRNLKLTSILPSNTLEGGSSHGRLPQLSSSINSPNANIVASSLRAPQRLIADMLISHTSRNSSSSRKQTSVPTLKDSHSRRNAI